MKKILPALLILFILLTLPVHAASGKLTATAAASGDTVKITVRLDNPGIIATRIFVRYDSAALQLKSAENGDVFPKGSALFGKDVTKNPYTMLWDESLRADNNTTSGTLCTLTFAVTGGTDSGKADVHFAVDKSSTFDVDLNLVTVGECSCSVSVPVVTTKAAATTTTTTKAAVTTTRSPAAATTKAAVTTTKAAVTTTKAAGTTTTKAAQPPQTSRSLIKPTVTLPKPTITIPNVTGSAGQTADPSAATTTAHSGPADKTSSAASTAAEGTHADALQPDETKPATVPEPSAEPASGETSPDVLPADGTLSNASESQAEPLIDPEAPTANHRNLLWLLLLIPAAAVIVLIVRKKKA